MIHLEAKKSLGQNFLVDLKVHDKIVRAINPHEGDRMIEIGPGTGLLTRKLLASPLKQLTAFELDSRAIPELQREFAGEGERFEVVEQDFLTVDLAALAARMEKKLRVAGNIPYYITSPILFRLIDERASLRDATLLVQLEVADRLTALPRTKAYGIPTVLANFFGEVEFLFKVAAGSFRPIPRVDSAVIRVDFERGYFARNQIAPPDSFDEVLFRTLVRTMFGMRRKTLRNNLKTMVDAEVIERMEHSDGRAFLGRRAEELTIEEFLKLYGYVVG